MPEHSRVVVNGTLGKFIAGVVIILLAAGVVGIWNMNGTMHKLVATVEFIKDAQVRMGEDVEDNADRIFNLMYGQNREGR